jgi:hypothetical protein
MRSAGGALGGDEVDVGPLVEVVVVAIDVVVGPRVVLVDSTVSVPQAARRARGRAIMRRR